MSKMKRIKNYQKYYKLIVCKTAMALIITWAVFLTAPNHLQAKSQEQIEKTMKDLETMCGHLIKSVEALDTELAKTIKIVKENKKKIKELQAAQEKK